jgi:Uma2 family endonuclease
MSTISRLKKKKPRHAPTREPAWDIAFLYPTQGSWTEADYFALERVCGNRMLELADGCLEILPMPDMFHQDIVKFLFALLDAFVIDRRLGRVYFAPLPIRLWPGQVREPDIAFFKSYRIKDKRKPPEGADLVMEIVSPGSASRERDLEDKRENYAKAKIPEYWIVDPEMKTITVLTLSGRSYKVHGEFKPGETASSKLLKGFKVAVADTFAAGEGFD